MFKQLLAFFTLHLVSRPWQEYHAWTLNVKTPMLANYFVSGSSLTEDVIGRVFTEGVREPEKNMLFAQNLRTGKEPQTSVIILPGSTVVDTHCIRLTNRMGIVDDLKDPVKIEMELRKVLPPEHSSDFCHCLVLHGRAVCPARKPDCERCCVRHLCRSFSG